MLKIALAGNPNCGKTTLFNTLTGSTAHVGNWPGVTVDKKSGYYKKLEVKMEIIDLPGIYSLSPYTPEEIVSRNFLIDENPSLVINVIDATNLERNLYLTTQILEIDVPVVVALNMMDIVRKSEDVLNIKELEKMLNVPVIEISALRNEGIDELMKISYQASKEARVGSTIIENTSMKDLYHKVLEYFNLNKVSSSIFHSVKLIEGDEIETRNHQILANEVEALKEKCEKDEFEGDYSAKVADARYTYISSKCKIIVNKKESISNLTKSDKIDKVLTHKFWGIPIFLFIMFLVFHLTFSENLFFLGGWLIPESFDNAIFGSGALNSLGVILFNIMDMFVGHVGEGLSTLLQNAPQWVNGLVVDALWGGIGAVLSFIPQILCLFFFLSILEDSGYMSRVAFIMDRAFRKFGLSGKAFMPLLMCFGCAVPGIMATRTLENEKERRLTIMLTPFFSCGAKLPIWGVFAAILFLGAYGDLIVFSMYLLGIVISIICAIILKHTALKGEAAPFIMELPMYHLPRWKNVGIHLWEKLKHYIFKAATVIAGAIVVIWFLSSFSFTFQMVEIEDSILGIISKGLSFLFIPLGFGMGENGYLFVVAAFTGLIAKEMVPATLGSFANMSEEAVLGGTTDLALSPLAALIGTISIPAAFAFMAFNLLSVPCMAAVAAAKGELNSRKKFWQTIGFWMLTAYVTAFVIFWGLSYWYIGVSMLVLLIISLTVFIVIKNKKNKNFNLAK